MDSNYKPYDHVASAARIDGILAQPQGNFEEVDSLPDRDALTYSNGYYAYCSAFFIDIRDSSKLPDVYLRPALAKLYRAYVSELVALLNSNIKAREINIVGDCVWGVFNTPLQSDIDEVYRLAYFANSLVKLLNYKLAKASYTTPLRAGIGLAYGRALMIKAGYNGSGIADVLYMGDVVNRAAKLASGAGGLYQPTILLDKVFAENLNDDNRKLVSWDHTRGCYRSDAVSAAMDEWYTQNCT